MQTKSSRVAPALRALLDGFIDYAGMFPPAALTVDVAVSNYRKYQEGDHSWMLRWLVVGAGAIDRVPADLHGRISLLSDSDDERAAAIESGKPVDSKRPVYCEIGQDELGRLDSVKAAGCLAKIRMGGLKPEAIPKSADVARFIVACADSRLAFKATAGLHHPIRGEHPLTYEPDAPRAVMHGFINLLTAAAFAWHGERDLEPVLAETDLLSFSFDDRISWRSRSLSLEQVREARADFIHSVGSCSFDEPVGELVAAGLL